VEISLPSVPRWDGNRDVVCFLAKIDKRRIDCAISLEALEDHFGANAASPLEAFKTSLDAIEACVKRLLILNRYEQDGSILVQSHDC
jgi:Protein of unknown function (DUF1488)